MLSIEKRSVYFSLGDKLECTEWNTSNVIVTGDDGFYVDFDPTLPKRKDVRKQWVLWNFNLIFSSITSGTFFAKVKLRWHQVFLINLLTPQIRKIAFRLLELAPFP